MSGALDDLRQKWAEQAAERRESQAVIDLEGLDLDENGEQLVDRDEALERLHREDDDDQLWRRCA